MFPRIRNEYGEIRNISPYSVQMRENTDQKNSEYGHFLRSTQEGNSFHGSKSLRCLVKFSKIGFFNSTEMST